MMAFTVTGVTLNHAGSIPGHPVVEDRTGKLPASLLRMLRPTPAKTDASMPAVVAAAARDAVGLDPTDRSAEWSDGEVYVAMPRPGGDAWVSIDRASGAIKAETTSQGWISWLNDLHKGRNTGLGWRLFIDAFAAAALVFTVTGLVLLQLHSRNRRMTWPLVGLGLVLPVLVATLFIH